jgi:hypothetical protein
MAMVAIRKISALQKIANPEYQPTLTLFATRPARLGQVPAPRPSSIEIQNGLLAENPSTYRMVSAPQSRPRPAYRNGSA